MARATRKNKEATEIVEENVSKKPKVDRKKRKNDEDNHDDMTELARERHAEWAKLVLGKIDMKSPGKRSNSASDDEIVKTVETTATSVVESVPTAPKRGKGKGALITNMSKAKSNLPTEDAPAVSNSRAKSTIPTEVISSSKKNNQNTESVKKSSKSLSPTRTPSNKAIGKQHKETPAAPKITNEETDKAVTDERIDTKMIMIISVNIFFILVSFQKYTAAEGLIFPPKFVQDNFHLTVWTFIIVNVAVCRYFHVSSVGR